MGKKWIERLTDRQKECLRLVAKGYTSKEIGRFLSLSPSTVDNHILTAMQIVEAQNRAEAGRMLSDEENRQNLPSQPEPLADAQYSSPTTNAAVQRPIRLMNNYASFIPPIGGQNNDLGQTERTIKILQLSAISLTILVSLVLLIAGALKAFS